RLQRMLDRRATGEDVAKGLREAVLRLSTQRRVLGMRDVGHFSGEIRLPILLDGPWIVVRGRVIRSDSVFEEERGGVGRACVRLNPFPARARVRRILRNEQLPQAQPRKSTGGVGGDAPLAHNA